MHPPVLHRQRALRELERHPEERRHPHPEQGPGTSHANRDRDAGDVADAHRRGKSRGQRLEMNQVAFVVRIVVLAAENGPGVPEAPQLDQAEPNGHEQAGAQ